MASGSLLGPRAPTASLAASPTCRCGAKAAPWRSILGRQVHGLQTLAAGPAFMQCSVFLAGSMVDCTAGLHILLTQLAGRAQEPLQVPAGSLDASAAGEVRPATRWAPKDNGRRFSVGRVGRRAAAEHTGKRVLLCPSLPCQARSLQRHGCAGVCLEPGSEAAHIALRLHLGAHSHGRRVDRRGVPQP